MTVCNDMNFNKVNVKMKHSLVVLFIDQGSDHVGFENAKREKKILGVFKWGPYN